MRHYNMISGPMLPRVFLQVDGWSTGPLEFGVSQLSIRA